MGLFVSASCVYYITFFSFFLSIPQGEQKQASKQVSKNMEDHHDFQQHGLDAHMLRHVRSVLGGEGATWALNLRPEREMGWPGGCNDGREMEKNRK